MSGRPARRTVAAPHALLLGLLVGASTGACFRPHYRDGTLACDDTANDACPEGYVCGSDRRCWLPGSAPPPGGGDAAVHEDGANGGAGGTTTDGSPSPRPEGGAGGATGGAGGGSGGAGGGAPGGGGAVAGGRGGSPPDASGGAGGARPDADPDVRNQLASLVFSAGVLSPDFSPTVSSYDLYLPLPASSVTVTPTLAQPAASTGITVNGVRAQSGVATPSIPAVVGIQSVTIRVDAAGGAARTYTITLIRGGLVTYFKASNADPEDTHGTAVAVVGDLMVVGAPGESSGSAAEADNTAKSAGAAYVYARSGAGWVQQAYLKASLPRAGDRFGRSVAISPSGTTLAIGAPGQDSGATGVGGAEDGTGASDSGAVYVFTRSGGAWVQQAFVKASNTGANDRFGASVALGNDTLLVGAPEEDSNATTINGNDKDNSAGEAGAAYLFARANGAWTQLAYVKAPNTGGGDRFGERVALFNEHLAIAAPYEDSDAKGLGGEQANNAAGDSGAVFTFARQGNNVVFQAYVKASNSGAGDRFGTGLALFNDVLVIGAPLEDSDGTGINGNQMSNAASDSGAVYVFRRANPWMQQAYVKAQVVDPGDHFGEAVAYSGNYLVIGAPDEDSSITAPNNGALDNNAKESGALYVFRPNNNTWQQFAFLKAPNVQTTDQFGSAVATSGDAVVCGAPDEDSNARSIGGNGQDNSAMNAGAVYVY